MHVPKMNKIIWNLFLFLKLSFILVNKLGSFFGDKSIILSINEICPVLLFTFFGDDFLPKLESYNVNNDIDILMNTYFPTKNNRLIVAP